MESQNAMDLLVAQQEQQIIQLTAELAATMKLLIAERKITEELEFACTNAYENLDTIQHQFDYGFSLHGYRMDLNL